MNYQNHYNLLISRSKSRILEGYSERHHIIPRCLDGDNSKDNLVRLTPEEHYLAHQLLVKIYPGNHKLIFATNMMSNTRPGNKEFGWLRRKCSIAISETLTGRTKETHEYIERISNKKSGRTKENHKGIFQQSSKMTGRTKETCPGIKSRSEKMTGRTKENHKGVSLGALKRKKLTSEQEDCLYEMKYSGIKNEEIQKFFSEFGLNLCRMTIYNIFNITKLR